MEREAVRERCHNKEEEPEGKERMEDAEEKGEALMLLYEGSHKKAILVKQTHCTCENNTHS